MEIGLFIIIPIILIATIVLIYLLKVILNNKKSTDIILIGMELTIVGGIFLINNYINFIGSSTIGIIMIFLGLGFSLAGLIKSGIKEQ